MMQSIVHVALVVRDYDEAIDFYTKKLNFRLVEDTYQPEQDKRWVVVAPPGSDGTSLLLARASRSEQAPFVGNQTGGRVFLFLSTDDFWRDYAKLTSLGVTFVREPKTEPYGTVAVFKDLYGNLWDLLEGDHVTARKEIVESTRVPRIGPYSQAVRVGDLLFTAGQAGIDPKTGAAAGADFESQARQAFENLGAVLEDAGSGMEQVVRVTC